MHAIPYLDFDGDADKAIAFYQSAIGAKVETLKRFEEMPKDQCGPMSADVGKKVMHAGLYVGDSLIFLSDGRCQGQRNFHGIALALDVPTEADADRVFSALADGGKINMPLTKTFFSPKFGMLQDRFGVGWMVMVRSDAA